MKGTVPRSVTMGHIYRGIVPFVVLQLIALGICLYWPELVLYLPRRWGFIE
jgi:TRAP-type mannitol/chloroaromatic compound transport system permease large subunit